MDRREYEGEYRRKQRAKARDIVVPACKDPRRRAELELDTCAWLSWYLPDLFRGTWHPDRRDMVRAVEVAAVHGGNQAIAGPRGGGKTSIVCGVSIKVILTGLIDYMVPIAANGPFADRILANIKVYLELSDRLAEDYPEVIAPIRALEGANNRAQTQTVAGELTRIRWSGDFIQLPRTPGSKCAGAIIETRGIDGALRGMIRGVKRPKLVLIDDPDTRESAASNEQTDKRAQIIENDIMGLGGDSPLAVVMLVNILNRQCLGYRFTNPREKPIWRGRRYRLMKRMPERMDMWDEYCGKRRQELIANLGSDAENVARATDDWYLANQASMDAGAISNSPDVWNRAPMLDGRPAEFSAIQRFFNLVSDKGWDFVLTEYQCDPPEQVRDIVAEQMKEELVLSRAIGPPRGTCPDWAKVLTIGVDCGKYQIHWIVVAWGDNASGCVVDYGTWQVMGVSPEDDTGVELAVRAAVKALRGELGKRAYETVDGRILYAARGMVDAGFQQKMIYEATSDDPRWTACKGNGDPNTPREHRVIVRKPDQTHRPGHELCLSYQIEHRVWLCLINSDYYKQWVTDRLLTVPGNPGAMILCEANDEPLGDHKALSEHIVNEYYCPIRRKWIAKRRNHWRDALYYAAAGAHLEGISLMAQGAAVGVDRRPSVSLRQMQEKARRMRDEQQFH